MHTQPHDHQAKQEEADNIAQIEYMRNKMVIESALKDLETEPHTSTQHLSQSDKATLIEEAVLAAKEDIRQKQKRYYSIDNKLAVIIANAQRFSINAQLAVRIILGQ